MRLRRRAVGVALAITCGTAAAISLSAPASATVLDPPGWAHIQGWGDGKCLWDPAHTSLDVLEVYACHNSTYEQWTEDWVAGGSGFMLRNHATGRCVQAGPHVVNGTALVTEPCDPNDFTQRWTNDSPFDGINHWVNVASGYCMDRPEQTDYDGEHMQLWKCAPAPSQYFPGTDYHLEQSAGMTPQPE